MPICARCRQANPAAARPASPAEPGWPPPAGREGRRTVTVLERHGGTVAKFAGDAVMAI